MMRIEVATEGERVAGVDVLCSRASTEYATLVSLSSSDLCALALARFAEAKLSVSLQSVLR
jgi:hypothetical protein